MAGPSRRGAEATRHRSARLPSLVKGIAPLSSKHMEQVSVVIPTRNAGAGFERILRAIRRQELPEAQVEIVVVDSTSTDGTPDLAEQFGATVVTIAPEAFNHGETRNLGIQHTRGGLVACTVQDALPANAQWLASLASVLRSQSAVAGAYSRQCPWPNDDALTRFLVNQWHEVQGQQFAVQEIPPSIGLASLPLAERRRIMGFDNVSAMIRRDVWETIPFRRVRFAEDVDWAKRVLVAGYRIVYEPASIVYHSHQRSFLYNLKRQYVDERILLDQLEADAAAIRKWNGPRQQGGLVLRVLGEARANREISPNMVAHLLSFALATMLGSLARRLIHPRLRQQEAPEHLQRWDAWFLAGV